MSRDIVGIRWREEGSGKEFQSFGDAFEAGTFREYKPAHKDSGYQRRADIFFADRSLQRELTALQAADTGKRIEVEVQFRGHTDPVHMTDRVKTTMTGGGFHRLEIKDYKSG